MRFAFESNMNWTYQTVMRSFYKPGKILSNARWQRTSRIWKAKLSERRTKCLEEKETRDETRDSFNVDLSFLVTSPVVAPLSMSRRWMTWREGPELD